MKRIKQIALALGFTLGLSVVAKAASTDSLTVTIRPNAFYVISISTIDAALDLGTVDLGASTQTVIPATVTVASTFHQTDLKLQGAIASPGGTAWTFDDVTTSSENNKLAAWATFTTTARSSAPAQGGTYFEGTGAAANSDVIDANPRYVGTSGTDGADLFENESGFDAVDMDAIAPNTSSHLWLNFRLPSATTSSTAQKITITLFAGGTN